MSRRLFSRFALFTMPGFITVYLALAPAAPAAQEGIPDRPLPGLSKQLDHYSGDPAPSLLGMNAAEAPGQTEFVTWSKLVFQSYRDNNWEIYLADGDGSDQIRLTSNNVSDIHPRLNQGASRIVFSSRLDGDYEIYAMNPDGSGRVQLTFNNNDDVNPDWSPDSNHIVFEAYRDGQPEIYVMNADGANQTRLTSDGNYDGMPTWSPDGSKIAFVSRRSGGYRIYTITPAGSSLTQLSNEPLSLYPAWSPTGTQIAYSADLDGDTFLELWYMNADGSNAQLHLEPGTQSIDAWARSWRADGLGIAYTQIYFINIQGIWYWELAYLNWCDVPVCFPTQLSPYSVDWHPGWQTMDTQDPVSQVNSLPGQSAAPIHVSWTGVDQGPSGIHHYQVQVKDGANGNWVDWLASTQATSALYDGTGGHTYYFRVRAQDNALHLEDWPGGHDAVTTVEALPPITMVEPMPAYSYYNTIVWWGGSDPGGSGIWRYDVQVKLDENAPWQLIAFETPFLNIPFQGVLGETYYFRSRAHDNAHNTEEWPAGNGDSFTTFYLWKLDGTAYDNRDTPIANINVTGEPEPIGVEATSLDGSYQAYYINDTGTTAVSWDKVGYGPLPSTGFAAGQNASLNVILPPHDNIIQNWSFESGQLAPYWQPGGTYPAAVTSQHHSGASAAQIGPNPVHLFANSQSQTGVASLSQNITIPLTITNPTLSFLYQLWGASAASGTGLAVSVDDGVSPTTLWSTNNEQAEWEHHWLDLSAWAGQTVTVTFTVNEVTGQPAVAAFLDNVSLGSAYPDIWIAAGNEANALPGELVVYSLSYGNRGGSAAPSTTVSHTLPADLTFVSASLPPVSTSPLVWDVGTLPANSGPYTIVVTATVSPSAEPFTDLTLPLAISSDSAELETINNAAEYVIHLFRALFLPIINR